MFGSGHAAYTGYPLVLAPTRELAAQIVSAIEQLSKNFPQLCTALLIGGVPLPPQVRALSRSPRIIVATPGRLLDHLEQRTISLSKVQILVLDEADRMLDMGFEPQLRRIMRYVPEQRQTMLFSATIPAEILSLASKCLKDPVRVSAGLVTQPVENIDQKLRRTTIIGKNDVLVDELGSRRGSVIIFARTKARTDRVAKLLNRLGHDVDRIHGDRTQSQRTKAIEGFRAKNFRILVATDIAARGLDIPLRCARDQLRSAAVLGRLLPSYRTNRPRRRSRLRVGPDHTRRRKAVAGDLAPQIPRMNIHIS